MAKYISEEVLKQKEADLQTVFNEFGSTLKGVQSSECTCVLRLRFNRGEAIESVCIDIDTRTGEFYPAFSAWSALTPQARANIESKRFDDAKEALDYIVETVNKINNFFMQF